MDKLRKIKVKHYFTRRTDDGKGYANVVEDRDALFHQFGIDYEEFSGEPIGFSIALIEWPDGRIEMVRADSIRFITPSTSEG